MTRWDSEFQLQWRNGSNIPMQWLGTPFCTKPLTTRFNDGTETVWNSVFLFVFPLCSSCLDVPCRWGPIVTTLYSFTSQSICLLHWGWKKIQDSQMFFGLKIKIIKYAVSKEGFNIPGLCCCNHLQVSFGRKPLSSISESHKWVDYAMFHSNIFLTRLEPTPLWGYFCNEFFVLNFTTVAVFRGADGTLGLVWFFC